MKLADIQAALRDEGVDGWLFFDHHRRDPLAYRILSLPPDLQPTRRWYYFVPADGEPRALCHRIESHHLDALEGEKRLYARWAEQREELRWLLGDARVVCMQYSPDCALPYVAMVDAGTVELIRSFQVEVRGSANLVQLFEARWTPGQLESHLTAGKIMDQLRAEAFGLIRERVRSGANVTEWDIRCFLRDRFAQRDLETDHGPIVAANANASDPHYEPTADRHSPIRSGDLVLIDMWAKLLQANAVYYDITWTGFCGDVPRDEVQNVFTVVTRARDAAVRSIQEAVMNKQPMAGFEVDDIAREHIEKAGFGQYFIHRTGHSIGTEVHGAGANMDNYETHDDRRIIASTCFSVEPGVYLPSFGIRSEVNVFVSETEARVTGETQTDLVLL